MFRIPRCFHSLLTLVLFLAMGCVVSAAQSAENSGKDDVELREALELYKQGKFVAAMPLFEKLVADHRSDPALKEGWAWCMLQYSSTIVDLEERRKVRV